jgi:hypothetical protein
MHISDLLKGACGDQTKEAELSVFKGVKKSTSVDKMPMKVVAKNAETNTTLLGDPSTWIKCTIGNETYLIPAYKED